MDPRLAHKAFEHYLQQNGVNLDHGVLVGMRAQLDFYRDVRANDRERGADGDMLLFQWGPYDRGKGLMYEVNLTRQLIVRDELDQDIWQLSLTYRYNPLAALSDIGGGRGDAWCPDLQSLNVFRTSVLDSPLVTAAQRHGHAEVTLGFEQTG